MGIESDQLVYDYLSRVGDLAQRRALTSGDRMRLVSRLRTEIERRRSSEGADTPNAVQRILADLGSPDEAVSGARLGDSGGRVPEPRREGEPARPVPEPVWLTVDDGPAPAGDVPDWWRVEAVPRGEAVHGFTGGIEIPDILKPPPPPADDVVKAEAVEEVEEEPGRPSLLRRADGAPVPVLLLVVALVLVVGAVIGNWIVLAAGWATAYLTRKLSHTESKWAVLGLPGLVLAGGVVWLWGRTEGRWGDAVPAGGLGGALSDTWPWVLRVAAVASAAFVMWRARRPG
ncbi:hypothetical protein [Streptomyces sp. ISL-11]|uniref:hypothetical protein n=1 Tax=Streptomyces sp. ISL-11 TaxID=2819174 RepID=UPI001BE65DAE|nr:hypothetical protein [Streptomyces sp. ISL-11]MBT2387382.1 hypothetical protein [Streptomyces sp. ISL-11]